MHYFVRAFHLVILFLKEKLVFAIADTPYNVLRCLTLKPLQQESVDLVLRLFLPVFLTDWK